MQKQALRQILVRGAILLGVLFISPLAIQSRAAPAAGSVEDRIKDFPNFSQFDPRLGAEGEAACGAVAAANGLIDLGEHGYPGLMPEARTEEGAQLGLIRRLLQPGYCVSGPHRGSTTAEMLRGLRRYVKEAGEVVARLSYFGNHDPAFPWSIYKQGAIPPREMIRQALEAQGSLVLLQIGWYRPGVQEWQERGAHWVTAIECQPDSSGQVGSIFISNPGLPVGAPVTLGTANSRLISLEPVPVRWLLQADGRRVSARGFFAVSGPGLPQARTHRAVLDGMIVLEMGNR